MTDNTTNQKSPQGESQRDVDIVEVLGLLAKMEGIGNALREHGVLVAGDPENLGEHHVRFPLIRPDDDHRGDGIHHALVMFPVGWPLRLELVPVAEGQPDATAHITAVGVHPWALGDRHGRLVIEGVEFDGLEQTVGPFDANIFPALTPSDLAPVDWGGARRDRPVTLRLEPGPMAEEGETPLLALIVGFVLKSGEAQP